MIKSELIQQLALEFTDLSEKNVVMLVNHIIALLSQAIATGQRIEIRGFGSFSLHHRPARLAHHPKTYAKLITKEKYLPHFKPGKQLKDRVNNVNGIIKN